MPVVGTGRIAPAAPGAFALRLPLLNELRLAHNGLRGFSPATELPSLKVLDVACNCFESLKSLTPFSVFLQHVGVHGNPVVNRCLQDVGYTMPTDRDSATASDQAAKRPLEDEEGGRALAELLTAGAVLEARSREAAAGRGDSDAADDDGRLSLRLLQRWISSDLGGQLQFAMKSLKTVDGKAFHRIGPAWISRIKRRSPQPHLIASRRVAFVDTDEHSHVASASRKRPRGDITMAARGRQKASDEGDEETPRPRPRAPSPVPDVVVDVAQEVVKGGPKGCQAVVRRVARPPPKVIGHGGGGKASSVRQPLCVGQRAADRLRQIAMMDSAGLTTL